MPEPQSGFSSRLREARESRGLTQEELAKLVGKGRSSAVRWEAGRIPGHDVLYKLSEVLLVSVGWLVGTKATPHQPEWPTGDERELLRLYRLLDGAGKQEALGTLREAGALMERLRPKKKQGCSKP